MSTARRAAALTVLALGASLAACDRNKAPAPPKPSTEAGAPSAATACALRLDRGRFGGPLGHAGFVRTV